MDLPHLPENPKHHPDCCLALSRPLVDKLSQLLPSAPDVTLSIGSGSGLLEAFLLARGQCHVEGVEVSSDVNKYLPEESTRTVGGTWDLCDRAAESTAWVFVYPRTPSLVSAYVEGFGSAVQVVVWLGPRADWADFEACFHKLPGAQTEIGDDCGVAPYEMMVVIRKTAHVA